jgi:hypothetical protein
MAAQLGLVLHHQAGNGSLFGFFNNPDSQVSAHFWVAKSGLVEQYVDSETVAWHAKQLNVRYCGVETEGCPGGHDEPLTAAQVDALGAIMAEGGARHGWPFMLANADGQPGLGYHRMAVNTACPCDLRLNARPAILAAAQGDAPGDEPLESEGNMIASTDDGAGYWTATKDGAVGAFGTAQYKGNALGNVSGIIVGIAGRGQDGYWLLASDGGVFAFGSAPYEGRPDRV